MRISMSNKISQRQYMLNCLNKKQKSNDSSSTGINYSNVRLLDESKQIFFETNAISQIQYWENLDENTNIAFDKALDAFDTMLCYSDHTSQINVECDFLIHEASKVRDPQQLQRSLKYRLGRIRQNITSSINDVYKNIKYGVDNSSNNIAAKTPKDVNGQNKQIDDKTKVAEACYNRLLEECNIICECDRIVKNYQSIHSRFNIDNIINEYAFDKNDLYGTLYEIAECVDTFNTPFKNRYNTALETAWYGMNKRCLSYSNSDIVNAVTDYYIFNGGLNESQINDIKDISKISPLFESYDFANTIIFDDEIPDDTINHDDYNYYGLDYTIFNDSDNKDKDMEDLEESALYKIVGIQQTTDASVESKQTRELFSEFREACRKNPNAATNIIYFKALTDKLTHRCPDQIPYVFSELLAITREAFVMNYSIDDCSTQIYNILKNIVNAMRDVPINKSQAESVVSIISSEIKVVSSKINKDGKDNNSSSRLTNYINKLKVYEESMKSYIDINFSEKDDKEDTSSYEFEEEPEDSEDGLKEAASIVMIANLMEAVEQDMYDDTDIDSIICGNVEKLPNDTIDALTDFSVTVPDIVCTETLKEAYINSRDNIRKKNNPNVTDYIRIDVLNENIDKLSEARFYNPTYNDPKGIMAYLICLDEFNRIDVNSETKYFNEGMNFTNTLKLAMNNLKRGVIKLSEKEKAASNNIDSAMNNIMNGMNKSMSNADREAIARGSILPSASKCIKIALAFAVTWAIQPAIAVIGAVGYFFCRKRATARERQLALDEIEVEMKMCDRYIKMYEDQNDMQKLRQCEMIQRNLQRQYQRIKYKMKVDFRHADTSSVSNVSNVGNND